MGGGRVERWGREQGSIHVDVVAVPPENTADKCRARLLLLLRVILLLVKRVLILLLGRACVRIVDEEPIPVVGLAESSSVQLKTAKENEQERPPTIVDSPE